nr:MAG TPA: hypothetical protein [Caudoviricetes sp.]
MAAPRRTSTPTTGRSGREPGCSTWPHPSPPRPSAPTAPTWSASGSSSRAGSTGRRSA